MTEEREAGEQTARTVEIDYTRNSLYRIVYAAGAWGGVTPQGLILMSVYSEYGQVPGSMTYEFPAAGGELVERNRVGKQGFVRELEVGVLLSVDTARAIREWLAAKIEQLEQLGTDVDRPLPAADSSEKEGRS